MTNAEVNRDIKRLFKVYTIHCACDDATIFFEWMERYGNKEFLRLYHADLDLTVMNKKSILMLMKMNRTLKVIPFHQFFIHAKIE
jgi:hypothetical protein